ncbi:SIR2 family protein [Paenibacillus tuaregi]|uniref:SIR2 family protein n=1 Tax=Paenibacillus tuaregi TaxID=1816681 RepID=UPI0008380EB3|nr:SIR2 family protein [Paenibacillus tuaregi]
MTPLNELIQSFKDKRVIPFIGAGFSKSCGFPSWYELIEHLLEHFDVDTYDASDNIDLLRVAEYLKIINGNEIGPIRAEIERLFNRYSIDITESDLHLHLVSLGAPIIYTTNYDNLIENTYKELGLPYQQVVTTRDIVKSISNTSTQIVKFHGSFEYEKTIVLTESDYFNRLEFESPIDIKLRSDLIGRSILFMGYSFSDLNIRYIWYKLKNMMKTVNEFEKPKSFILLSESDKIMSTLFQNIGIIPISLSDFDGDDITEKISDFLQRLVYDVHFKSTDKAENVILVTKTQVGKFIYALESRNEQEINAYTKIISRSNICNNHLRYLLTDDFAVHGQSLGLWFDVIVDVNNETRYNIIHFMHKLNEEYGLHNCFSDILILCFLRYPEVRSLEMQNNWQTLNMLFQGMKLEAITEFQILFDALTWAHSCEDLRKDTTFYFIFIIHEYFKDKLSQIIHDPCVYDDPDDSDLPKEYFNITPQFVLEYIQSKAEWLPDIEFIIENINSFDRILEALGGTNQGVNEFIWDYKSIDKETAEKILLVS